MKINWKNIGSLSLFLCAIPVCAQRPLLWRDPGNVAARDFIGGPGGCSGKPVGPFRFVRDDGSGTQPKITVRDAGGRNWSVKWGDEVKPEIFASRLAWAIGYYADPMYLVRKGRIVSARELDSVDGWVDEKGNFRDARFELRNSSGRFLKKVDWTWEKNPFVGTRQLNGLKVLLMLVSNWDNKDGRHGNASNTGIIEYGRGPKRVWAYMVTDWGASMGKWGNLFRREKWDCEDYAEQTPKFVKKVEDGEVEFGFGGHHSGDFKDDIRPADVRWLMRYLGQVTDAQIRDGLRAAGADSRDLNCFAQSIRARINQLKQVAALK